MNNNLIVRSGFMAVLLLAVWGSCGGSQEDPATEEKPDAVIENLQTRLRIVESNAYPPGQWVANPRDIITYYPPTQSYRGDTVFGYADVDGNTILCKVLNLPEYTKQWKDYTLLPETVTEADVKLSGSIRLYTGDNGEKYGTLELTSIEKSDPESKDPVLPLGVYAETYPNWGAKAKIDFIDAENVKLISGEYTDIYKYEIRGYSIILTNPDDPTGRKAILFFRTVNSFMIEMENGIFYMTHADGSCDRLIMTFEKENIYVKKNEL